MRNILLKKLLFTQHLHEWKRYITSFPGVGENGGKKRTYYQITDEGRLYYQSKCKEWALTKEVIEKFIVKEN